MAVAALPKRHSLNLILRTHLDPKLRVCIRQLLDTPKKEFAVIKGRHAEELFLTEGG